MTYFILNEKKDTVSQIKEIKQKIDMDMENIISLKQSLEIKKENIVIYNYATVGKCIKDFYKTCKVLLENKNNLYFLTEGVEILKGNRKEFLKFLSNASELDFLLRSECTLEGLEKAKRSGQSIGRQKGAKNLNSIDRRFGTKIKNMRKRGLSYREIAKKFNISTSSVYNVLHQGEAG